MKTKIQDLRDHMFAALERLNDEELTQEQLKVEIGRATAISEVGKVIVDSAKVQVMAVKTMLRKGDLQSTAELEEDVKKFLEPRPKAEYSNMQIANGK